MCANCPVYVETAAAALLTLRVAYVGHVKPKREARKAADEVRHEESIS